MENGSGWVFGGWNGVWGTIWNPKDPPATICLVDALLWVLLPANKGRGPACCCLCSLTCFNFQGAGSCLRDSFWGGWVCPKPEIGKTRCGNELWLPGIQRVKEACSTVCKIIVYGDGCEDQDLLLLYFATFCQMFLGRCFNCYKMPKDSIKFI